MYERLDVLWDGAEYLALVFAESLAARVRGAIFVRSEETSGKTPRLIAAFEETGKGPAIHIVRLPHGHRFVTVSPDLAMTAPELHIMLADEITPGNGVEWRLLLLQVASTGAPSFDTAVIAAPQGYAEESFEVLRERRLNALRMKKDAAVVWGVRCMEQRTSRARTGRAPVELTISPVETVFPEERHIAPIGIEPMVAELRTVNEEPANVPGPYDPFMPVVARTITAERGRRLAHGLRLRTSREDPIVQWVQRRSAIIHVRRQAMMDEIAVDESGSPSGPRTVPFNDADIEYVGNKRFEQIVRTVPTGEPAIRPCGLFQILSRQEHPMEGIKVKAHKGTGGEARADQTVLWFDGAALGDDIGIVSTQAGALKLFGPAGLDGKPTNMLMFRVGPRGLLPIEFPEHEKRFLSRAAARVQAHDAEANVVDRERQMIDDARRALEGWYSDRLRAPFPVLFGDIEPFFMQAAVDLLAGVFSSGIGGIGSVFDLFLRDPAVCAALVAHPVDAQHLRHIAAVRQSDDADLLHRLAHAYDAAGIIVTGGVLPETEVEALGILHDHDLRGRLLTSRIALDSSTHALRADAQQILKKLADRGQLKELAKWAERQHPAHAVRINDYLALPDSPRWIELSEAFALAEVADRLSTERARINAEIDAILVFDPPLPNPADGARSREEILNSLHRVLGDGLSVSEVETSSVSDIKRLLSQAEQLDNEQLLRLESKALTLVYGPARERLINDLLGKLEAWAELPKDFLIRVADGDATDATGTAGSRSRRRNGAEQFKKRVDWLQRQSWTVPDKAPRDEEFTHHRVALRKHLTDRRVSDLGNDETHVGEFEQLVIPMGDLFLHHRAFLGLRTVSVIVRQQPDPQDEQTQRLARQLARGLVNWPYSAAAAWKAGTQLASLIGKPERQKLDEAVQLPTLP